jgi:hypothetical protein
MLQTKINLACGGVFISANDWINLDYSPASPAVRRVDLLGRLPLPDNGAALVYSSHFLEHIPRAEVPKFLAECLRILAPGGVLRLVLPDLENLCRAYLAHRERGEHAHADVVVLEMIDQCVRRESGGELGRQYQQLKAKSAQQAELIEFVRERTGEDLLAAPSIRSAHSVGVLRLARRVQGRLERLWVRAALTLLPKAFRLQNISFAGIGERHHWLWDFHQLRNTLTAVGFVAIERCEPNRSRFAGFPFQPLDIDPDGRLRKGSESMYVEAQKPD